MRGLAEGPAESHRDFGKLSCARVSVRVQLPEDKVRKVVVDGATAELTLTHGVSYPFRKIRGSWRLDS